MAEHDRQERTDRLEITIRSVESLQQTGVLKVERAKGGVRETANIVFLNGQPVEAVAGARTAQDALDWLLTWGSCRYTFEVRFPSEIVVPPLSSPAVEESPSASPLAFFSQVVKKYTHPLSNAIQVGEEMASEEAIEDVPTAPFPLPYPPFPAVYPLTPLPQPVVPPVAAIHQLVPFRLLNGPEAVNYMERFGLSRLHRQVFFLLDGHRTAFDVVRLTGRSFYEIQSLLAELERLGLIRMERTSMGEALNGM
jgi:hypothetical protein